VSFLWPAALFSLLLLPIAAAWYLRLERRRRATAAVFSNPALLPNVARPPARRVRHGAALAAFLALAVLLVGLGRPQFAVTEHRRAATVVLALDTSRSMAATDVRPNRLEAAKRAAEALIARLPSTYRVGVVAFASGAQVVAPATTSRPLVVRAIEALRIGSGTAVGDAIGRSLAAGAATHLPTAVVVFSDGAQTGGTLSPAQAARKAHAAGVSVSTVLLGAGAAVVQVPVAGGHRARVVVAPDPGALRAVAALTRGRFLAAPDERLLARVYRGLGTRVVAATHPRELTDAFAGVAALLFLTSIGFSASSLGRVRP
jgi:Ca-activated chloride channel family protein